MDIIRHYADLPASFIDDIANTIDDPENGVTLAPGPHQTFDNYKWYFVPTGVRRVCILNLVRYRDVCFQVPNQYRTVGVGNRAPPGRDRVITFLDHSREGYGVPVPNPKYIELHSAVARILHLSGAGEAIDAIMDRFSKHQGGVRSDPKYRTGFAFRVIMSSLRLVTVA